MTKLHPLDIYFVELRNRRRKDLKKKKHHGQTLPVFDDGEDTFEVLRAGKRARPRTRKKSSYRSRSI